jgi:hypothetical protein
MVAYELSQDCAVTVLLHASKYPSCTINGVLLGKPAQGSGPLVLSAAIPLFHSSSTYLSPCVEAALTQVSAQHAVETPGCWSCVCTWASRWHSPCCHGASECA